MQKGDRFLVPRSWPFLYGYLALSVPKCRGGGGGGGWSISGLKSQEII